MTPEQRAEFMRIEREWRHDSDRLRLIAYVDSLLAAERAATIEECAKVLDPRNPPDDWTTYATIKAESAAAIRKLGEKRE